MSKKGYINRNENQNATKIAKYKIIILQHF